MNQVIAFVIMYSLVSYASAAQECNGNSEVDAFNVLQSVTTAQLRYVTNPAGDVGTCVALALTDFNDESKTAVYYGSRRAPGATSDTMFTDTAKVTECPYIVEVQHIDENEGSYLAEYLYTDYDTCLIDRVPSPDTESTGGCRMWALNGAPDEKVDECKNHFSDLEGCGEPTAVYDDTC